LQLPTGNSSHLFTGQQYALCATMHPRLDTLSFEDHRHMMHATGYGGYNRPLPHVNVQDVSANMLDYRATYAAYSCQLTMVYLKL
jgi:hypothetical protein